MTWKGELLERGLDTVLQSGIVAALDVVEARWSAIDAITLPEPANYASGYRPWMLTLPSTAYPYLLTIVSQRATRNQDAYQLGFGQGSYQHQWSAFLIGQDEDEAVAIAHRYAEALVDLLQANRVVEGCIQVYHEPAIQIYAENRMHLIEGERGDLQDSQDVDYMRLIELTQTWEG